MSYQFKQIEDHEDGTVTLEFLWSNSSKNKDATHTFESVDYEKIINNYTIRYNTETDKLFYVSNEVSDTIEFEFKKLQSQSLIHTKYTLQKQIMVLMEFAKQINDDPDVGVKNDEFTQMYQYIEPIYTEFESKWKDSNIEQFY